MAKISPVSIKYIIYAKIETEGTIERPDTIGAIFGQTEGLLGEDLELRKLQKEGKIGRIEVNIKTEGGKTKGEIEIPSAMGKEETTIIAAAIETIERVGPSDAKIKIEKIEDVRGNKRDYIIERAKKLLGTIEGSAETREIEDAVKVSSKMSKLQEYGKEGLSAGDISGKEIIVVEGRADVITLIKQGINNVIGMNGSIFPETIKELSKEKEITLFVDGDRGGDLIAKTVIENSDIDYVTKAPDGKEVEELTGKEILVSLRKKVKADEFLKKFGKTKSRRKSSRTSRKRTDIRKGSKSIGKKQTRKDIKKLSDKEIEKIREMSEDLIGTKGALLLDENLNKIKKVPLSQLSRTRADNVYVIVIDGAVNLSVIKSAEKMGCEHLAAKNFSYTKTYIDLVSL